MARQAGKSLRTLYEFSAKLISGETVNMSQYKDKVVLIQNVASLWGTTVRDYTQMNQLADKFGKSLQVMAFPCNQFGHQVIFMILYSF